jgi:hypothetical protein
MNVRILGVLMKEISLLNLRIVVLDSLGTLEPRNVIILALRLLDVIVV